MTGDLAGGAAMMAALDESDAADRMLAAVPLSSLTITELQAVADRLEARRRRQPAIEHQIWQELRARTTARELGAKNWAEVLATRLRLSNTEARRRLDEASELGPRLALTGQPMAPALAQVAAAQAAGLINAEHVRVICRFVDQLPTWVDVGTREAAEGHLVKIATGSKPEELRKAADRLALLIDQDGPEPNDAERARRRHLTVGRQGRDGMTEIRGLLDPEARAALDAVLAKWAAPGMCNPEDETACVDDTPSPETTQRDMRSHGQRNHDALKALARAMLASGRLGSHNGLPVTVVVTTTLQELQSAAGQAVTGGGSLLPMSDVIRMAAHAHHYLAIYDEHTHQPLYLGRTKRLASPAQRLVLYAHCRGCTFPGCTVPGYGCQVHHAKRDFARGGQTNVDEEVLACGPHNRLVEEGGWTTRIRADGRCEWIPPPHLDTGHTRTNDYHHPERYLTDEDDNAA